MSWNGRVGYSPRRLALLAGAVAVLSYAVAELGGALVLRPQLVSPLWLGNVLLASILLLVPRRIWPVVLLAGLAGSVFFDVQAAMPFHSVVWFFLSNGIEILVAAFCLHASFGGPPRLNNIGALVKYSFYAVFLAPFVGAFFGALSTRTIYWASWRVAFFSEALGFLTLMPAILGWAREFPTLRRRSSGFYIEAGALFIALLIVAHFALNVSGRYSPPVLLYSLVPLLLWSTLRFRTTGVSTSIIVIAFLSIWGAVHERGPFMEPGAFVNVPSLQLFLFFTAAPFMALAVLVEESKDAEQVLRQRDSELNEAQRLAQTGSWHWDPHTDAVTWSAELYRLAGYDPRFSPPSFREHERFFVPESWLRLRQSADKALRTGAPFELDLQGIRLDGTKLWLTMRGEAVRDARGRVIYLRGTTQDITERKISEEALLAVSGHLITAQEEERARIARELHDDLSQRMALLQIGLDQFRQGPTLSFEDQQKLDDLLEMLSELSSDLHDLSRQLHPAALESVGLVTSLKSFCKEFSAQHKLQIHLIHKEVPKQIPHAVTLCLYRIVQEALRNVVKHSGAVEAEIELVGHPDGIDLCISDQGQGFDVESIKGTDGLGLVSMRERLRLCGGHLCIDSELMQGTHIHVRIPQAVLVTEVPAEIHQTPNEVRS